MPESEIAQLEIERQLKLFVDSMKLIVALIIVILSKSLKSNSPNKNNLITDVSSCTKIFGPVKHSCSMESVCEMHNLCNGERSEW